MSRLVIVETISLLTLPRFLGVGILSRVTLSLELSLVLFSIFFLLLIVVRRILGNICLTTLFVIDRFESLQRIQQLSEIVSLLVQNIVVLELLELRGQTLKNDAHLSLLVNLSSIQLSLIKMAYHL